MSHPNSPEQSCRTYTADQPARPHPLESIMSARSVVILGASDNPMKISGRPMAYMLANGYAGKIYAVNPSRTTVQKQPCYPSLTALAREVESPVDLAIVGTAAEHVQALIEEGIECGIRSFVVFSSGFSELGLEGQAMQNRLTKLAQERGVSILGPNCLGVINSRNGLIASFTTSLETTPIVPGNFSFASQSGALGAYWLDIVLRSGVGFSQWITTGNECDVDISLALEHLVKDPHTRVIGLYIEDIRNPARFRLALHQAATEGKPVIAIKAGRSVAGAAAAASHTGAMVGADALYDACLAQYGAIRVESLTEMMDVARLLTLSATPNGRRLGVMSVSGGAGVLIADACEPLDLTLPAPSEATRQTLAGMLPAFVHPANPLDITGNVLQDTSVIARTMQTLTQAREVDAIVLFIGMMHSIANVFVDVLTQARQSVDCPIIVIWVGALPGTIEQLESQSIPVFLDIPQAIQAIARTCEMRERVAKICARPLIDAHAVKPVGAGTTLSEWDSKQRLAAQSAIHLPPATLLNRAEGFEPETLPAWPVVAKLQSAQLLHKSEVGGIILGLQTSADTRRARDSLFAIADQLEIHPQGVLIESMIGFDHELLLGLQRHSRFGPVLTIARGGVQAELDPDTITRLMPLAPEDIITMLQSLRCARLLTGFRGQSGVDIPALANRIAGLCDWFMTTELAEIEINPLAVRNDQAWALDALITLGEKLPDE